MSQLKAIIDKIVRTKPKVQENKLLAKGGFRSVYAGSQDDSKQEFAVSKLGGLNKVTSTSSDATVNIYKIKAAQALLAHKQVETPFLLSYSYHAADGVCISDRAQIDLFEFLNKLCRDSKQIACHDFLDILGQVILGLEALHNKHIVHRDIKFENIVITECEIEVKAENEKVARKEKFYYARIIDIAELVEVYPATGYVLPELFYLAGTEDCAPAELQAIFADEDSGDPERIKKAFDAYRKIDLKPVDCYALAVEVKNWRRVVEGKLEIQLNNENIIKMKNSECFGAAPEARELFFQELLQKGLAAKNSLDKSEKRVVFRHVESDDGANFLPQEIQEIVALASSLDSQLDFCLDETTVEEDVFAVLEKRAGELTWAIQLVLRGKDQTHHQDLAELQALIPDEVAKVFHRLDKTKPVQRPGMFKPGVRVKDQDLTHRHSRAGGNPFRKRSSS